MKQLNLLLDVCSESLGVPKEKIMGRDRLRPIVVTRQIYAYLARKYFSYGLLEIGKSINKDHTTIIHSIKMVEKMIELNDPIICIPLEKVMDKLRKETKREIKVLITIDDLIDPNIMFHEMSAKYNCIITSIY